MYETNNESSILWFYPEINRFTDDYGQPIHNLSHLFDLWEIEQWKRTKQSAMKRDRKGIWRELCYPDEFENKEESYYEESIRRFTTI